MPFNKKTLMDFAKLATLAYEDQDNMDIIYKKKPHCQTDIDGVLEQCQQCPILFESKENDCEMYVCNYKSAPDNDDNLNTLVVAFRGTSEVRDALSDLNAIRKTMEIPSLEYSDEPYVHWGFYNQFLDIKEDLDNTINQHFVNTIQDSDEDNKNIVFCGHSLGAGLATLASVYYGIEFPTMKIHCVTLGSPRVGGTQFNRLFNQVVVNSYRFVNRNDLVTMIPTRFRFSHVRGLHWLTDGTIRRTMNNRLLSSCRNSFYNWFGFGGSSTLDDHGCDKYLENMQKNLNDDLIF